MEEFQTIETVKTFLGETGKVAMLDTNIAGSAEHVMINLINGEGKKIEALLSKQLSKQFRQAGAGRLTLGAIMNLEYGVNQLGRYYVVRPQGTWKEFAVGVDFKEAEYKVETLDFDKLVAF